MAQVSLKNIKKVYPVSKDKKHKKREDGPNLQITEEGVVAVQQMCIRDRPQSVQLSSFSYSVAQS